MIGNLIDVLNHGDFQNIKNILLLFGVFYAAKLFLNMICNFYNVFKTFLLPLVWPRNFKKEYGHWAVITGCSKGIGLRFAHELAKKSMNLVLIARKAELLNKIAHEIQTHYGVQVEVIIADFGSGKSIFKNIEEGLEGKDIGILINNVGVAYEKIRYFHEASEEKIWNMINVNISAMTLMTKMILPKMEAKKKGAIINVSSVAAFTSQPLVSMYSASKAYVDFLSRGLSYEYCDKGITIQCVMPGPVMTDMLTSVYKEDVKDVKAITPTVDAYAAKALSTLGFSHRTTGYWLHGFMSHIGFFSSPRLTQFFNKDLMMKQLEKEKTV